VNEMGESETAYIPGSNANAIQSSKTSRVPIHDTCIYLDKLLSSVLLYIESYYNLYLEMFELSERDGES
jgi:hypothetical protein